MSEEKVQVVFVSPAGLSHLKPTVQFAKLLINDNHHFNVTFLIIPALYTRSNPINYIDSVTNSDPRLRFISFPPPDDSPPSAELYKQNVKQAITQLTSNSNSVRLFLDMFDICMVDVAKELGIPCYLFFTSGAANLGFLLVLPAVDSKITTARYIDYATELEIPSYSKPLPTSSLPTFYSNRWSVGFQGFVNDIRLFHETKGVVVNTFAELELQAVHALHDGLIDNIPPVYVVGPFLDLEGHSGSKEKEEEGKIIVKWLDDQPESSVLFISFGTVVSLGAEQVKEIANGLERSGEHFLWSLGRYGYVNPEGEEVVLLPDGFLERVGGRGMVCEWAPQVKVLAHKSTRGFVTHCGWNSILESVWFGVPMITWPFEADQGLNAFQLVKDLGIAVEIREGHHRKEGDKLVVADEVQRGVKDFLESESDMRKKMKEMSVKCREALVEGGSSSSTLKSLVQHLTNQL